MLACMLGENRAIFFPKLVQEQMMTFDSIATNLLHEYGYEVLECSSDEEAIDRAANLKSGSKKYPVHFEKSDTSGEKQYEEFYTDNETVDMDRFKSLGVISDKQICDRRKLAVLLDKLNAAFDGDKSTKADIVRIVREYLPNFDHIETGKSLDGKM